MKTSGVNFEQVSESTQFKTLMKKKKKFLIPWTLFFLVFYFTLPILTSYTNVLNTPAIGDISWVWIYAMAQFVMTWILCTIYVRKFYSFDKDAEEIIEVHMGRRGDSI
ncbi:DUF485 domain-containing protein [Bacillus sp. FSL K6-3431]|uniref:DUF485 domain-containing protein n=1 Tax=Bacillus sp. FSL K6-3431 TaxID=2921500 RepID=UPI0030F6E533